MCETAWIFWFWNLRFFWFDFLRFYWFLIESNDWIIVVNKNVNDAPACAGALLSFLFVRRSIQTSGGIAMFSLADSIKNTLEHIITNISKDFSEKTAYVSANCRLKKLSLCWLAQTAALWQRNCTVSALTPRPPPFLNAAQLSRPTCFKKYSTNLTPSATTVNCSGIIVFWLWTAHLSTARATQTRPVSSATTAYQKATINCT